MFALIIKKEITIQPLAVDAKSQKRLGRIIAFLNGIVKGKGDKMGAVHTEELLSESSALRLAKYKVPYEIAKGVLPASFIRSLLLLLQYFPQLVCQPSWTRKNIK